MAALGDTVRVYESTAYRDRPASPMFGWFSKRPDHPLADPGAARALIESLRGGEPCARLDEVRAYLDTLRNAEGFAPATLFQVVEYLDEAAKPHQRRLTAEYVAAARLSRGEDLRLWRSAAGFWESLANAYLHCLELAQTADEALAADFAPRLAPCCARAIRAVGAELKWLCLRYQGGSQRLWASAARAYAQAEVAGVAATPIRIYAVSHGDSSVQREYLRVLVLGSAGTETLLPAQVEIAERAIGWFARGFDLRLQPDERTTHYVDLATQRPPTRYGPDVAASPNRRYFGIADARSDMNALLQVVKVRETLPESVRLGEKHGVPLVIETLEYLLLHFSPQAPRRAAPRTPLMTRLLVAPGFRLASETILREHLGEAARIADTEAWLASDESDNGFGAQIPQRPGDWLRIGALVAVRTELARFWGLGIVRRLASDGEEGSMRVGLRLWTKAVLPITLRAEGGEGTVLRALLLSDHPDEQGRVEVVLAAASAGYDGAYGVQVGNAVHRLHDGELIEAGDDYDYMRFRVTSAPAVQA